MNGNSNAVSVQGSQARPVSPCDAAYDQICCASEEHERLLDELFARLGSALRDPLAGHPVSAPQTGPVPAEDPVMSELHGRLIGTAKRVRQQNSALRDILDRLTL